MVRSASVPHVSRLVPHTCVSSWCVGARYRCHTANGGSNDADPMRRPRTRDSFIPSMQIPKIHARDNKSSFGGGMRVRSLKTAVNVLALGGRGCS